MKEVVSIVISIGVAFLLSGCQQGTTSGDDLGGTSQATLVRASDGSLYSTSCLRSQGFSQMSSCQLTSKSSTDRAALYIPYSGDYSYDYSYVYNPPYYSESSFCPYFFGVSSCYSNLGYTNYASYYSYQNSSCSACMNGFYPGNYSCLQNNCVWQMPSPNYWTVGNTQYTLTGNFIATDGSGGLLSVGANGTYTLQIGPLGQVGTYGVSAIGYVTFSGQGTGGAYGNYYYSCNYSFPTPMELFLTCYQPSGVSSALYWRQ